MSAQPRKTPILPGFVSHRNQAIKAQVFLDTGNLDRTLTKREVARKCISDDIIRKPDVTYHAANGKLMHSCGPVELTVKIIFDELTNNIDTL